MKIILLYEDNVSSHTSVIALTKLHDLHQTWLRQIFSIPKSKKCLLNAEIIEAVNEYFEATIVLF